MSDRFATDEPYGDLEVVATFTGPMPTGVTVSHTGRIFVNFPKWGDEVTATVAELRDGDTQPYPDQAWNSPAGDDDPEAFVSVQSVVVDPADRLWVLDTGSPMFAPTRPGGPKLVCVDLTTNTVAQRDRLPRRRRAAHHLSQRHPVRPAPGRRRYRVHHRLLHQRPERHHRGGPGQRRGVAAAARSPVHQGRIAGRLPPTGGGTGVPATSGRRTGHPGEHGVGRDRHLGRRQPPLLLPAHLPAALQRLGGRPGRPGSRRRRGGGDGHRRGRQGLRLRRVGERRRRPGLPDRVRAERDPAPALRTGGSRRLPTIPGCSGRTPCRSAPTATCTSPPTNCTGSRPTRAGWIVGSGRTCCSGPGSTLARCC